MNRYTIRDYSRSTQGSATEYFSPESYKSTLKIRLDNVYDNKMSMEFNANYKEISFKQAKEIAGKIFNAEANLPENVFLVRYPEYRFCDFYPTMTMEFWNELEILLKISKQESLICGLVDPDPSIYLTHVNKSGFISLTQTANSYDYFHALTQYVEEDDIANFYISSNKFVWMVESLEWGLWGERQSETCVLGCGISMAQEIDKRSKVFMSFTAIKQIFDSQLFRKQQWKKFGEGLQKVYCNAQI